MLDFDFSKHFPLEANGVLDTRCPIDDGPSIEEEWKQLLSSWETPERFSPPSSFDISVYSSDLDDETTWEPSLSGPLLDSWVGMLEEKATEKELRDRMQNDATPLPLSPFPSFAPVDMLDHGFKPMAPINWDGAENGLTLLLRAT